MNLEKLKEPFEAKDIEWRIGRSGQAGQRIWATALAYVTARAAQDRLDDVVGAHNWKVSYSFEDHGILCSLAIKCGDEWIRKVDGAPETQVEAFKGGISSAFKRAASVWGIGRYLYHLDETFVEIVDKKTKGSNYAKLKDGPVFYWLTPTLPSWALPGGKTGGSSETHINSKGSNRPVANGSAQDLGNPLDIHSEPLKTALEISNDRQLGWSENLVTRFAERYKPDPNVLAMLITNKTPKGAAEHMEEFYKERTK